MKKRFTLKKDGLCRLAMALVVVSGIGSAAGCQWENKEYDDFVDGDEIAFCPTMKDGVQNDGDIDYIQVKEGYRLFSDGGIREKDDYICDVDLITDGVYDCEDLTEFKKILNVYKTKAFELKRCPAEFECIEKEGRYYCLEKSSECPNATVRCGAACIDPLTDNKYCGAKIEGTCDSEDIGSDNYKGDDCTAKKERCVEGKCIKDECTEKDPKTITCSVNGSDLCVNVNSDNQDHCGSCNNACENDPVTNAKVSTTCSDGKCLYECYDGFINCGTGITKESINCIDPNESHEYCGAKGTCIGSDINESNYEGKKCLSSESCFEGHCVTNKCDNVETLCSVDGEQKCIDIHGNDESHCGGCNNACEQDLVINTKVSTLCMDGFCQYECIDGFINCGAGVTKETINCIDPNVNNDYCGAKGTCSGSEIDGLDYEGKKCLSSEACFEGNCVTNKCDSTETLCSVNGEQKCINVNSTDASHCGACNNACENNPVANAKVSTICNNGKCEYECEDGYINCGTGKTASTINCIDPNIDTIHCGAKGNCSGSDINETGYEGKKCLSSEACFEGNCVTNKCDSKETLCSVKGEQKCININSSNVSHCGACNNACDKNPVANAKTSTTCNNGKCEYECEDGYVNCGSGKTAATINCIDPKTNNFYCGAKGTCKGTEPDQTNYAGTGCLSSQACFEGSCITNKCSSTETLCSVSGEQKCIDIKASNANHCGACNNACKNNPVANAKESTTCSGGKCQYECKDGYINCGSGKTAATINCIDPKTNNFYCGAKGTCKGTEPNQTNYAGKGCSSSQACFEGNCITNKCSSTETLCSVNGEQKCIDINASDANHCGACNFKCSDNVPANAVIKGNEPGTCTSGKCQFECMKGFTNKGSGNTADKIYCVSNTVECPSSQTNCKNICLTTSLLDSVFHVSGSGNSCACKNGFDNVNKDWSDGCETCATDYYNCSSSGFICLKQGDGWGTDEWTEASCKDNCTDESCVSGKKCNKSETAYTCSD